ncbi:MAG: hypothetical protein R6W83_02935 [Cryobacterium sp.]
MNDLVFTGDALDRAVLAVPGVADLYASAPVGAITRAAQSVTGRPSATPCVLVARHNDALNVAAKIGVAEGFAAADVCRRVYDALETQLAASAPQSVATIAVTVARIG